MERVSNWPDVNHSLSFKKETFFEISHPNKNNPFRYRDHFETIEVKYPEVYASDYEAARVDIYFRKINDIDKTMTEKENPSYFFRTLNKNINDDRVIFKTMVNGFYYLKITNAQGCYFWLAMATFSHYGERPEGLMIHEKCIH